MLNRHLFLAVPFFLAVVPQTVLGLSLNFDMSLLDNPELDSSNVFVTFAANQAVLTLGGESIDFSGGSTTINGTSYGTSKSYSFQEIEAAGGFTLTSATSLSGFISYGSSTGLSQLASGVLPGLAEATTARYSQFEVSYSGTPAASNVGGGMDLTNISQFGGSLRMELKSAGVTQSYVQNTLNTGDTFRALAATSTSSPAAVYTSGGNFVRVVGPNFFPASISGSDQQTPYAPFNSYLQNLHATYGAASVTPGQLTNLAPGASPGGQGAVGLTTLSTADTARVAASAGYNLDYHFDAKVIQVSAPDSTNPNGTYSVQLTGYVNAIEIGGDGSKDHVYNGLSITVAADNSAAGNLYMTNFLYQEAIAGNGINVVSVGWDALNTDFGAATVSGALLQKAADDFAQGILSGFVGSNVAGNIDSSGTKGGDLGTLSSYEWWTYNQTLAYDSAGSNYSPWGNVISKNSDGENGSTFSRGGVYGSPYDDRFALNLLQPNNDTDEIKITLQPDGDLSVVPEPSTYALLTVGFAFLVWVRLRKSAPSLA